MFGDVVYSPGGSHATRQVAFQLVHIVEGEAVVELGREHFIIQPGEIALITPGPPVRYTFSVGGSTRHTWCTMINLGGRTRLGRELLAAARVQPLSERLAILMEMGFSLGSRVATRSPNLLESLARCCLEAYLEEVRRAAAPTAGGEPPALARTMEWIAQHGHEPVDAAGLARHAGISRSALRTLFLEHLNTTPMRYVWRHRTERGIRLLRETGLTVAEIAWQCGFQTPFHFSRWVRQVSGIPPRAVRGSARD